MYDHTRFNFLFRFYYIAKLAHSEANFEPNNPKFSYRLRELSNSDNHRAFNICNKTLIIQTYSFIKINKIINQYFATAYQHIETFFFSKKLTFFFLNRKTYICGILHNLEHSLVNHSYIF